MGYWPIGALLKAAEDAGFELLLSTDKNIRYQQNLTGRRIAIIILGNSTRPVVDRYIDRVISERSHTRQLRRSGHSIRLTAGSDCSLNRVPTFALCN